MQMDQVYRICQNKSDVLCKSWCSYLIAERWMERTALTHPSAGTGNYWKDHRKCSTTNRPSRNLKHLESCFRKQHILQRSSRGKKKTSVYFLLTLNKPARSLTSKTRQLNYICVTWIMSLNTCWRWISLRWMDIITEAMADRPVRFLKLK